MKGDHGVLDLLSKEQLIDVAIAFDDALAAVNQNNARLAECFTSVKDVTGAMGLIGSWANANALATDMAQRVFFYTYVKASAKLNETSP